MAESGIGNPVWFPVSAYSTEGLGERRPSLGDLGAAHYKGRQLRSFMREIVLAHPNCFIVLLDVNA